MRKLGPSDRSRIARHLVRLGAEGRRLRFGYALRDEAARAYAASTAGFGSLVLGVLPDGHLRAVGELGGLYQSWPRQAEIALSVEQDWQNRGVGSMLFARLVTAARNRYVRSVRVSFLAENAPMRRIVAKHHARLARDGAQVETAFGPPWPTPFSITNEIMDDTRACLRLALGRAA